MKVREVFVDSLNRLKITGAELDVRILLSYFLGVKLNELFHYLDTDIDEKIFLNLLNRRVNREPLANIIGKKAFWEYDFVVNKDVLTPRADTESMINAILDNYELDKSLNILELGIGSGCILLTLLKLYRNSKGVGIDISEKAIEIATQNAKRLDIQNCKIIKGNWNNDINTKFDLIISNPPYIKTSEIDNLEPEVKIHNPLIALDGGNDGLDCYRYLAKNLSKNFGDDTKLFLEIGDEQKESVVEIFKDYKFIKEYSDLSGTCRVLSFSK
jgi:release factor glutamine methyltransferase